MVNIIVADNDLDSHELVHDILEINFRDVHIDRALNLESFLLKLKQDKIKYDLILLNPDMQDNNGSDIISLIKAINPDFIEKVIIMSENESELYPDYKYHIPKPFSLDYFGEIVKKACYRL